ALRDDEAGRYDEVARRKESHDQPADSKARHGTATPAHDGQADCTEQDQETRELRDTGPLRDLDVRRRVLSDESRGPEKETEPLGRRADHRENAIGGGESENLEGDVGNEARAAADDYTAACPQ